MPRLKIGELRDIKKAIEKGFYWFDRKRFLSFLSPLAIHESDNFNKLRWLLETWGHPDRAVMQTQ